MKVFRVRFRRRSLALAACAAAGLAVSAPAATAHAQVVVALESEGAGASTLDYTPGSAGIAALDTACGSSQMTIHGTGTVGLGNLGAGAGVEPGDPTPQPVWGGGGVWYTPWSFTASGGSCSGPGGTIVLDMSGLGPTGGVFDCPGMTGSVQNVAGIVQFTISGVCSINFWHTHMTFTSLGVADPTSTPGSEVVDSVMFSAQQGDPCC